MEDKGRASRAPPLSGPIRGACCAFQYSGRTIGTCTRMHRRTGGCTVTSCHCSLQSVKGKISIPDLHEYAQTHLGDSLLGCFWLQEGLGRAGGLCWIHPWSSLFTQNMKININMAPFDASPCYTFICKTEQLGWTESVCLWGLWRACVFTCVFFSVCVCVCYRGAYINRVCQKYFHKMSWLLHLKKLIMLMIHPVLCYAEEIIWSCFLVAWSH